MAIENEILKELQNISFLMGDVNAIRNGEYDPPRGADPDSRHVMATTEDVYSRLGNVIGHLERIGPMLYVIGEHLVGPDWQRKIGEG